MSNSVSGTSKISSNKKSVSSKVASSNLPAASASVQPLATQKDAQTNEAADLSVEYMDDYRNLMLNYDPAKNKSAPEMTKYECALVVGKRATQLAHGAIPLIDVPSLMTKVDDIAAEELRQKKTPFIIRRDLGNGKYEYWKIKDMKVP